MQTRKRETEYAKFRTSMSCHKIRNRLCSGKPLAFHCKGDEIPLKRQRLFNGMPKGHVFDPLPPPYMVSTSLFFSCRFSRIS